MPLSHIEQVALTMAEPNTMQQDAVVSNSRNVPVDVWFEPWGMNHTLAAGESFELQIESEIDDQIEIVESDDGIEVYSFPTSTIKIFQNGSLIDDLNVKFPQSAMPKNKHIMNPSTQHLIDDVCRNAGITSATICTPEQLLVTYGDP